MANQSALLAHSHAPSFSTAHWPESVSELSLDRLRRRVRDFTALEGAVDMRSEEAFHEIAGGMHALCGAVAACEIADVPRAEIRLQLRPARTLLARSPFVTHLQTWPRGYQGDFEAIDWLMSLRNRAPEGTLAFWAEECALHSAIAQQHRNKIREQQRVIEETILASSGGARVLVIACGAAHDLRGLSAGVRRNARFVLNDADPNAIAVARRTLGMIEPVTTYVEGNVFQRLKTLERLGPYDLVVAGGLFDYLPDRAARLLIRQVYATLLAPAGRFYFTNIATNPFRIFIEYLGDWRLIERTEPDIAELTTTAGIPIASVTMGRDQTGLSILVTIQRAADSV